VSVTGVSLMKRTEQALAHPVMPAGSLLIVPLPVPAFLTLSVQQVGGIGTTPPMVGGIKTSAVLSRSIPKPVPRPPATRMLPFASEIATWLLRASVSAPADVHSPDASSYSSAEA